MKWNFDTMFGGIKYVGEYLTQKWGFNCTSSSYQLHCPPCNIMPPGVVNWNPRKESRHSRNFFVEVILVILQTISFEINKQSINPTYLNLGHAKALIRTLSATRLNERNNHICQWKEPHFVFWLVLKQKKKLLNFCVVNLK